MRGLPPTTRRCRRLRGAPGLLLVVASLGGCAQGVVPVVTPLTPGNAGAPREVNIIAKDYQFLPEELELVPGETVLLHVINGGLEVHEAIIGDEGVQDAWEVAEAAVAGAPPGPTPVVSVPPDLAGLRIVVRSGERVDVVWTVPDLAAPGLPGALIVGCHIPGHWERGMWIAVRPVDAS
jgi:uncharacterized cupredoxin-like copper-binding protein